MSKFFKALEKVEHERDRAAEAPVAPPRPEPIASPFARPPVKPAPVEARSPVTTAPDAGPAAAAPTAAAPTAAAPTAAASTVAAPTVYGAPVARTARGHHGFAWQIEPAVDDAGGDIDDHLVSLLEPTSFAAEQYRAARLALETLHQERGTRVVGVASPGRGEGRTLTALNLAGALAQASQARVALVEADLRHPAVAGYLGLSGGRGLCAYLLETTGTVDDVLQRPSSLAFAVLPAGPASSMPYELLKSPRMAALLDELRQRYDYVLVDTPSALPFPDVGILRDLVDGFVVVVRANRTARERLEEAIGVVGRRRVLGLVFNDDAHADGATVEPAGAGWRRLVPRPLGSPRG